MRIYLGLLFILLFAGIAIAQESPDPYGEALRLIEEAEAGGSTEMGLSGLGLTQLPPEIGRLINITALYLSNNQLSSLPPEIGNLSNLRVLDLNNNQLASLPPEIGNLRNLRSLELRGNQLTLLPVEIANLGRLRLLALDGNPLASPPHEVIAEGTPAIQTYLRNEAWWHLQKLIVTGLTILGVVTLSVLGLCWKNRRGKRKNSEKL